MLNYPDTNSPAQTEEKLVLPAPADEEMGISSGRHKAQIYPGLLIHQKTPSAPKGVLPKLAWYWRKDPAYKVFMISLVMVILAGGVFISLASASLFGLSLSGASYPQNPSANVAPSGTVDLQPGFPRPSGGQGSTQSSQPPAQKTPSLGPTATGIAQPNPTPQPGGGGSLTVQITNYTPNVVSGGRISVTVFTNQPGITVFLQIHYSAQVFGGRPGAQVTDGNGNATFTWFVFVSNFGHKTVQAVVTAIATDQNGQRASSTPVVIQITPGVPIA